MLNPEDYVRMAKAALGNAEMTDRELGEFIGFAQPAVSQARYGRMSDAMAVKIADTAGIMRGVVIQAARIARENDKEVRDALLELEVKTHALIPLKKAAPLDLVAGGMRARGRIVRGSAGSRAAKNTI